MYMRELMLSSTCRVSYSAYFKDDINMNLKYARLKFSQRSPVKRAHSAKRAE
jgi:hypothetical protein